MKIAEIGKKATCGRDFLTATPAKPHQRTDHGDLGASLHLSISCFWLSSFLHHKVNSRNIPPCLVRFGSFTLACKFKNTLL